MFAIIGGSGLDQLANLEISRREKANTPYGDTSADLSFGRVGDRDLVFIARHGDRHTIPPHLVNYRANIWALANVAHATQIVSIASVGGIRADLGPGAIAVPHQIVDYTYGRQNTFQDGRGGEVVHVDFTHPYDEHLRGSLLKAAKRCGEKVSAEAVYAATQGPRLESAAEINRLERDGADIVGMTGMPEATLARELALPYAAVCVVANWAAGRAGSRDGIVFSATQDAMQSGLARVRRILEMLCQEEALAK